MFFVYLSISTPLVWLLSKQLNIYICIRRLERPRAPLLVHMLMNIVVLRLCIQCGRPENEKERKGKKNSREHSDRARTSERGNDCPAFLSVLSLSVFLFHRYALAFSHSLLPLTATRHCHYK